MNDNEKIMYSKLFTVLITDEKLKTKYLALIKSILTKVGKKYVQNILDIYPDFFECLKKKYPGNKSWVVTPLFAILRNACNGIAFEGDLIAMLAKDMDKIKTLVETLKDKSIGMQGKTYQTTLSIFLNKHFS